MSGKLHQSWGHRADLSGANAHRFVYLNPAYVFGVDCNEGESPLIINEAQTKSIH